MEFNPAYAANTIAQLQTFIGGACTSTLHVGTALYKGGYSVAAQLFATLRNQPSETPRLSRELAERAWAQADWRGVVGFTLLSAITYCAFKRLFTSSSKPSSSSSSKTIPADNTQIQQLQQPSQQLEAAQQRISELEGQLKQAQLLQTTDGRNAVIANMQEQIEELTSAIAANELEIGQLTEERKLALEEVSVFKAQAGDLEEKLHAMLAELKSLQNAHAALIAASQQALNDSNTSSSSLSVADTSGSSSQDSEVLGKKQKQHRHASGKLSVLANVFEKSAYEQQQRNATLEGVLAVGKQNEETARQLAELKERERALNERRLQVQEQINEYTSPTKARVPPTTTAAASSSASSSSVSVNHKLSTNTAQKEQERLMKRQSLSKVIDPNSSSSADGHNDEGGGK